MRPDPFWRPALVIHSKPAHKPKRVFAACLLFCLWSRSACALVDEATKRPRAAQAIEMNGFQSAARGRFVPHTLVSACEPAK